MRAIVVTTITTSVDLETFKPEHSVSVEDEDGLSEVSPDVLGAVLLGGLAATTKAMREKFPRAARINDKQDANRSKRMSEQSNVGGEVVDWQALSRVEALAAEYDRSENWRTWGVPAAIRRAAALTTAPTASGAGA